MCRLKAEERLLQYCKRLGTVTSEDRTSSNFSLSRRLYQRIYRMILALLSAKFNFLPFVKKRVVLCFSVPFLMADDGNWSVFSGRSTTQLFVVRKRELYCIYCIYSRYTYSTVVVVCTEYSTVIHSTGTHTHTIYKELHSPYTMRTNNAYIPSSICTSVQMYLFFNGLILF